MTTMSALRCGRCCPSEHPVEWQHVSCAKPEGHEGAHICDHWMRHKFDGLVILR